MQRTKFPKEKKPAPSQCECIICAHKLREEIESEILIGTPLDDIAEAYNLNPRIISKHLRHMTKKLVDAVLATKDAVMKYFDEQIEQQQNE